MNWLKKHWPTLAIGAVAFAAGAAAAAYTGIPKVGKLRLAPSAG